MPKTVDSSLVQRKLSSYFIRNNVIDFDFYKTNNPDVLASEMPPEKHYIFYGQYEKRKLHRESFKDEKFVEFHGLELRLTQGIVDKFKEISSRDYSKYISEPKGEPSQLNKYFNFKKSKANPVLISIIISSYNGEEYLCDCLNSIEAQSYKNIEVIIIDDCSSDNSVDIINRFFDKSRYPNKYRLIKNNKNIGLAKSLQLAIKKCSGDYIAFLEQGDIYHADNLKHKCELLFEHPKAHLIVGFTEAFGDLSMTESKYDYLAKSRIRLCDKEVIINAEEMYQLNYIPSFSSVMVEAKTLRALNFDINQQKLDWYLWAQILRFNPLYVASESVTFWRQHEERLSADNVNRFAMRMGFRKSLARVLDLKNTVSHPHVDDIDNSDLFDKYWYSKTYNVPLDNAAAHYLEEGWLDGHDPSESFSSEGYLAFHRDVKDAGVNPLLHFIKHSNANTPRLIQARNTDNCPCDILLLTSTVHGGAVFEYRMKGLVERFDFGKSHISFDSVHNPSGDILNRLANAKVVIFNRPLSTGISANIIRFARSKGCTLVCDFDDLISDELFYINGGYLSGTDKEVIKRNAVSQLAALPFFDHMTVSTVALKTHFSKYFDGEIYLVANKIRREMVKFKQKKKGTDSKLKVGIFSGSPTHEHDIKTVLLEIIVAKNYYDFELYICGVNGVSQGDKSNGVKRLPFYSYSKMLRVISKLDLVIVPLAFNQFNECKSNIRFLEAGSSGTPVLAANIGEYKKVIEDNVNGFLYERDRFLDKMQTVLGDEDRLISVGQKAFDTVELNCSTGVKSDDEEAFVIKIMGFLK